MTTQGPPMSDSELLPCPFCGGSAGFESIAGPTTHSQSGSWSVGCMNSEIDCIGYQMLASFSRKCEAAEAWNKRALTAQGDAQLREALENIALLDEADGHELKASHALEAIAIATKALGKHPSEIHTERYALPAQGEIARVREALEDAVSRCSYCDGKGNAYSCAEDRVGQAPGSSRFDCPNCTKWRAALRSAPQAQGWRPLLEKIVQASDALPSGHHSPREVQKWLNEHLGPAIKDAKAALAASPPHPASASRGKVEEKKEVSGSRL